jgi:hypothetical protein
VGFLVVDPDNDMVRHGIPPNWTGETSLRLSLLVARSGSIDPNQKNIRQIRRLPGKVQFGAMMPDGKNISSAGRTPWRYVSFFRDKACAGICVKILLLPTSTANHPFIKEIFA